MNLEEKEKKLLKFKKILDEYIKQSTSADDNSPFILDEHEMKWIKEYQRLINKMEVRIAELKKAGSPEVIEKKREYLKKLRQERLKRKNQISHLKRNFYLSVLK